MTYPDLLQPLNFIIATLLIFVIVIGRYFLIAGFFQLLFYKWQKKKWAKRWLGKKEADKKQFKREVGWSLITALIFAVAGTITAILWQRGFTKLYTSPGKYGYWYLPISLIISMLIHETYYYWLHRWMHNPKVFKMIHKVHHDSNTTSAWTAFSFHPFEGLLQAIILPLTIIILPMHVYVVLVQLTLMTFSSVINHLEIETYPANFHKHFIGRWIIGATHHSLHHKQFKYNFGLYFTILDKFHKTESPRFYSLFEQKTKP
jgi:lathosterol oxidase